MASVFGGPPGIKNLIPRLKESSGFLEKLVLDPAEVKAAVAPDLLANARRRAEQDRAFDAALLTAVRALEAFAQVQLFKQHKIKAQDVQPDQLPAALKEPCRTCWLDDVDGKRRRLHYPSAKVDGVPIRPSYTADDELRIEVGG